MRWWLLPRVRGYRPVLLGLIIGVALTEGAAFLGLFLLPEDMPATQAAVFFLSLFSFMQLAPYYARRLGEGEG